MHVPTKSLEQNTLQPVRPQARCLYWRGNQPLCRPYIIGSYIMNCHRERGGGRAPSWQKSRSGEKASSRALFLYFRNVKQHSLNKPPFHFGSEFIMQRMAFDSTEMTIINSASSLNVKTSIIQYPGYFCYATWTFYSVMNKLVRRWHQ